MSTNHKIEIDSDGTSLEGFTKLKSDIRNLMREDGKYIHQYYRSIPSVKRVSEEVKKTREDIENSGREQDIRLKKHTLYALFGFLSIETILIFIFSYLQATYEFGFMLEEWSFKLLVAATITQITYMLQVAVKHLFPTIEEKSRNE